MESRRANHCTKHRIRPSGSEPDVLSLGQRQQTACTCMLCKPSLDSRVEARRIWRFEDWLVDLKKQGARGRRREEVQEEAEEGIIYRGFPTRMVYLYYISCWRYTILVGNPRYTGAQQLKRRFMWFLSRLGRSSSCFVGFLLLLLLLLFFFSF